MKAGEHDGFCSARRTYRGLKNAPVASSQRKFVLSETNCLKGQKFVYKKNRSVFP